MNDDQHDRMIAALAEAFDTAARGCTHKKQAAIHIHKRLQAAGYKIETRNGRGLRLVADRTEVTR